MSNRAARIAVLLAPLAALAILATGPAVSHAADDAKLETPYFAKEIAEGRLPPRAERLPQVPRVIDPRETGETIGRHGGAMRWLMGKP